MIHLHVHTKYSLLDGMIKIEEIADKLKSIGQNTIAITEHGNLYSSVEAYSELNKQGIKVINGCEVYICDDVNEKSKDNKYYHLILLCKNEEGRINLQKLVSESTRYKYYGKPRIDFNMLKQYHNGLICMSACMAGEVSKAINNDDIKLAEEIAIKYQQLFKDDYYIEYQAHENEEQQKLNAKLILLANKLKIKYVVTCDAHYLNKEDQKYHSVFVQVGSVREVGETYNDCYLQSEQEVLEKCWLTQQYNNIAINNTQEIADKCENTIPLSAPIIPHVDVPKEYKSELDYLKYLCNKGFKEKGFLNWNLDEWKNYLTETVEIDGQITTRQLIKFNTVDEIKKIYIKRANYEINALKTMGFEGYYLLVYSYVSSVKRRGIARGSGGGSLLAYLCGIVDIDPIKYGLYFERFIDVGALDLLEEGTITRKELKIPDFDVDFAPSERHIAVDFVVNKYHQENVVALGQFTYMWAKGAIKDIGKVLGIPFEITNEITKNLDKETIDEALELGLLVKYKNQYPELFEYASKLSGLPKSFGVHPCGKCVCVQRADYYNAIEYNENTKEWVLQGDMHTADNLGLVKADFLGLRTLDVIYDVLDMIDKDYDYIAPHKINMNDKLVWSEFSQGNTDCIFQFESNGMKKMLKEMKCDNIENLSAANALYRPGSLNYIPNYINRKNGIEDIVYLHDDLKPILSNSYGIIVFQEQLIEIGKLAKLKNPDELRQATAKKKAKLMAKIEPELKNGLINRGWTQNLVDKLWEDILQFAKYSFNKSHSSAYALTAYISMYLKVHHTAEFFTAYINSYNGDIDGIVKTIIEAKRMNVDIGFDNWKNIQGNTICKNNKVLLGINTIKGFGLNVADGLQEVGQQNYNTFIDLITAMSNNCNINKTQIEVLITHNFLKEFGKSAKLLNIYKLYQNIYTKKQFNKDKLPIDETIIKQYADETPKQYRNIRSKELFNYLCQTIEDKDLPIKYIITKEASDFGYIKYINPKAVGYCFVLNLDTKYSPKITLYKIDTGETIIYKLSKKDYSNNPINNGDIIKCTTEKRNKTRLVDGKWQKSLEEFEEWIKTYIVRGD